MLSAALRNLIFGHIRCVELYEYSKDGLHAFNTSILLPRLYVITILRGARLRTSTSGPAIFCPHIHPKCPACPSRFCRSSNVGSRLGLEFPDAHRASHKSIVFNISPFDTLFIFVLKATRGFLSDHHQDGEYYGEDQGVRTLLPTFQAYQLRRTWLMRPHRIEEEMRKTQSAQSTPPMNPTRYTDTDCS